MKVIVILRRDGFRKTLGFEPVAVGVRDYKPLDWLFQGLY